MDNRMEKRHHKRRNLQKLVILESLQIGIDENSRMTNCSDDGLYFESNQLLQPGTKIFIRIENFPHNQTETYICHHAKILWGRRLNYPPYAFGYGAKYVVSTNKKSSSESDPDQTEDLRKHPRENCAKPATLRFGKKSCDGFIRDISRGGCFIESAESLHAGQIVDLVIPGTKFSRNNRVKVEVVRLSPIGVGVQFKRIKRKKPPA